MTHLTPDQLLDVADGTRTDGEFPHLAVVRRLRAAAGRTSA